MVLIPFYLINSLYVILFYKINNQYFSQHNALYVGKKITKNIITNF